MQDIIWALICAFYLVCGLWCRKEHKKLDNQLNSGKSVEFIEYLVLGCWPLLILFSIFVFVFMVIKFIF